MRKPRLFKRPSFVAGSLDRMVATLEALDVSDADRRKIMAETAVSLLGL